MLFNNIKNILSILFFISFVFNRVILVPTEYSSIQNALNEAIENDTILIDTGYYYENIFWPNTQSITLLGQSIDSTIITSENQGSIFTISNQNPSYINNNTFISNFTLMNGNATLSYPEDRGGAISLVNVSPLLNNIIIENCSAIYGGGISIINSSPVIENIIIKNNFSQNSGGGIYIKNSNPILNQVELIYNTSNTYGGGFYSLDNSIPIINNCNISNNFAESGGGFSSFNSSSPIINQSYFLNNNAIRGGAISTYYYSNPQIINTLIDNNTSDSLGGGVHIHNSSPLFIESIISNNFSKYGGGINISSNDSIYFVNTEIKNNIASKYGGGINIKNVNPLINSVAIHHNSSELGGGLYISQSTSNLNELLIYNNNANYGGGIFINDSKVNISDVIINSNLAVSGAGILANDYSEMNIYNSEISFNNSESYGGAIDLELNSKATITKTIIHHNEATLFGGGIYLWEESNLNLFNVTLVDNISDIGSGISLLSNSNGLIINSILWNNGIDPIYTDNSNLEINYSNIENGFEGIENIRTDPDFQDLFNTNYSLNIGSKCIDNGTTLFVLEGDTLFYFENDNFYGINPDIGSKEYIGEYGDINIDGFINIFDIILMVDIIFNNLDYNELGDLNNDYQLSILDVIIILNLIFNI